MPLRVTIELIPRGIEELKETIFMMDITNDGSGSKEYGNYKYVGYELADNMHWENASVRDDPHPHYKHFEGWIGGFPRRRSAKELVRQIIGKIIIKERNETDTGAV